MNSLACVLTLFLVFVPQSGSEVESAFDKKADVTSFHTYVWARGQEAYDPASHKTIVDAIDARMTALGFKKAPSGQADVVLKYHTVRGTDVDLKLLEKMQREGQKEPAPTTILGRLVVVMYRPGTTDSPLWQASTRRHLSNDAAVRAKEIDAAVGALFQTYPRPKK